MPNMLVCICVLLFADYGLSDESRNFVQYTLASQPGCHVFTSTQVDFEISQIEPSQKDCHESATICVTTMRTGTTVVFTGVVDASIFSLTVAGDGYTAIIPVVHVAANQHFAKPMVGVFKTVNVPYASALRFILPIQGAKIEPSDGLVKGTPENDCENAKLCYIISGNEVALWGTQVATSITFLGKDSTKVVIPLFFQTEVERSSRPPLLAVLPNGAISSNLRVMVPFIAKTVKAYGGPVFEKASCNANHACYEFHPFPTKATIKGVMPVSTVTISLQGSDASQQLFSKSGLLTSIMSCSAFLMLSM